MTKSPAPDQVGDSKSTPLLTQAGALRGGADQAASFQGEAAARAKVAAPVASLAASLQGGQGASAEGCRQILWFSFFFDGTGNNLDADLGTGKHSSVAKLWRVHREDDSDKGIYRFYVPGVGTYFSKVGDDGGSSLGLGTGDMGDDRRDWAIEQFDARIKKHLARAKQPMNTIDEINLSAFGFSRGAALARAFVTEFIKERCTRVGNVLLLKGTKYRVRIRFMGLFDTVASVGLPMSANTTSVAGTAMGSVKTMIRMRRQDRDYARTLPVELAFAKHAAPGADPAPGRYDGHASWGGDMEISEVVEEVRHYVAAHEVRNSFPLDSVSVLKDGKVFKPAHFYEAVFPGVHSDVGGSYRPGEGAKGYEPSEKLGLIPLAKMYDCAVAKGVPLLPRTAWQAFHTSDFKTSPTLIDRYNHYQSKLGVAHSVGALFNLHMALFYAWKFRAIRLKQSGDKTEARNVAQSHKEFDAERIALEKEIAALEKKDAAAMAVLQQARVRRLNHINANYGNPNISKSLDSYNRAIEDATVDYDKAHDLTLRAKARLNALPNMSSYQAMLDLYEAELMLDAKAIHDEYSKRGMFGGAPDSDKRKELRPHYKVLVEAYENEFIHKRGLADEKIIAFFDNYVHDSLTGFAKDATLPSDPRVIYLGGDEKYQYALLERRPEPGRAAA